LLPTSRRPGADTHASLRPGLRPGLRPARQVGAGLNCSRLSEELAAVVRTAVDGTVDPAPNVLSTCLYHLMGELLLHEGKLQLRASIVLVFA